MKRPHARVLTVFGCSVTLLCAAGLYSQSTDNKEVKQDKKKSEEASKASGGTDKRKLKGSFKGQPIETPQGQTLSDVVDAARAARDQKQQAKEQGKPKPPVISNVDLAPKPAAGGKPQPAQAPPSASAPPAAAGTYRPTDLEGHDETYWHEKAKAARDRMDRAREAMTAADAEAKKQENDFYSWDDGQYRDNIIKPAWDRAKDALASAQKEMSDAQEALKNLEDDARKAGAMPGWIR